MDIERTLATMAGRLHDQPTVDQNVDTVTDYACAALGADDAGVLLLHRGSGEVPASTHASIAALQTLQVELGEGPCVDTITDLAVAVVHDVRGDERWPRWLKAVDDGGYRSVAACRVSTPDDRIGSLNVFARAPGAFDERDVEVLQLLAAHAAVAIASTRTAENLQRAVASRDVAGQAKGILMERFGVDAATAFTVMVRISQDTNTKLTTVAERIVETREVPRYGVGDRS